MKRNRIVITLSVVLCTAILLSGCNNVEKLPCPPNTDEIHTIVFLKDTNAYQTYSEGKAITDKNEIEAIVTALEEINLTSATAEETYYADYGVCCLYFYSGEPWRSETFLYSVSFYDSMKKYAVNGEGVSWCMTYTVKGGEKLSKLYDTSSACEEEFELFIPQIDRRQP